MRIARRTLVQVWIEGRRLLVCSLVEFALERSSWDYRLVASQLFWRIVSYSRF